MRPFHLLPSSTSCINLIFTDQSNLVVDSGTYSSLNSKCHHQIKFKNQLYNTYIKNFFKGSDYNMLQEAINEVSKIISQRKEEYHYHLASKLSNHSTSTKTY